MKYGALFLLLYHQFAAADPNVRLVECGEVAELANTTEGPMKLPSDVGVDRQGRAYVVDAGNQRVLVFTSNGEFLFSFGSEGAGPGELHFPVGIAVAGDGRVLVADRGNRRIQVFDSEGRFRRTIETKTGNGDIVPVDVAVDGSGQRIYVTASAPYHQVFVLDNDGKLVGSWGGAGNNEGEFRYPATIAVSAKDDEVYVADVLNTRVQVFNEKGLFLVTVGSWGVTQGELFRPKGVALTGDGHIVVSDSYLGVVQVFNSDTRFRGVLSSHGEIARFTTPAGVAVDSRNRIYIVESMANRVSVCQLAP